LIWFTGNSNNPTHILVVNAYGVTAKSMIIMKTKKDNVIDLFGVFGLCFLHGLVFFF
jgi:hypothetical protein